MTLALSSRLARRELRGGLKGFRILDNHSPFNTAGRNYIYMAWAEAPTFNLFGGQSNAR